MFESFHIAAENPGIKAIKVVFQDITNGLVKLIGVGSTDTFSIRRVAYDHAVRGLRTVVLKCDFLNIDHILQSELAQAFVGCEYSIAIDIAS